MLSALSSFIPPNSWSYPALLGLLFPYSFWALLISTIVQFFIKKIYGWVALGVMLIFYYPITGYWQINLFASQPPENAVKIMSFNVRLFNLYNWSENVKTRDQIFDFLREENPDVMCFQEFYHQNNSTKFPTKDTLKKIFKDYNWHEKYTHEMHHEQYFGVVTMSRYPIVNSGDVPFDNDPNNFCIYSDLLINDDTVRVFNAHIGSIRLQKSDYSVFDHENQENTGDKEQAILGRLISAFQKRQSQAEKILSAMSSSPYPVVISGDFNDTPFSYIYRQINAEFTDAFRVSGRGIGTTYIGKVPPYRIDYIFHSPSIQSYGYKTHDIELSDHRPISCYFIVD